ncbi:hypothetical protein GCM10011575_39850 [Microlunatus endophyticus]|uniref:DUF5666 domain-containing protein n=1 Tax=Microlunatus endophyticus TaxID=1716077 RepID=A0A917SFT4_9ACTN|nr:hypothetical protein [Microlunatus endophyticus]GGL77670.1 hypothetical protein GCM10011575_39850 [Microlunatus endophyticus]
MTRTSTRILAGAGLTTAVLAIGTAAGVGIASADPSPSPTPTSPSSTAAHPQKQHKARTLLQRTEHGQFTLAGKKHRVADLQRGSVSSVSSTSIKIASKDGYSASYVINSKTVVRERAKGKKPAKTSASAIKKGDRVNLVATQSGKTATANKITFKG